jgi:hypothetical protein
LLAIFLALPLIITIGLLFVRRAEQRLIGDLIKTIYMMADDPTVTQPMPVSMRAARNFAELVQALELLSLIWCAPCSIVNDSPKSVKVLPKSTMISAMC